MKEIKGIIPAMVTPFDKNGAVNTDSIKKLVNVLINENADGFYICGICEPFWIYWFSYFTFITCDV